jgi:hypothetical protein
MTMHVMIATCRECNKLRTTIEFVATVVMKISVFLTVTSCLPVYEYVYVSVSPFYRPRERTHFNPLPYTRHDRALQNLHSICIFL